MATITDTTTDANGNIIINVSSSADDAITLATAGTYSDKNIIFNVTTPQSTVQSNWNQNDSTAPDYVKNRPFYTGDPVETAIVEEITVPFSDSGDGLYIGQIESTFSVTVGETYKVSWDGSTYECICGDIEGILFLGNLSIAVIGPDTGEPFLIGYNSEEVLAAATDTSASHTISISGIVTPVVKIDRKYLPIPFKPKGESYLTFRSPNKFTLSVKDAIKHWNGALEYFDSDENWTVWDGTSELSAITNGGEYALYLRGTRNTIITGGNSDDGRMWYLNGADIKCIGNIENLLDYATVKSGAHPDMSNSCYSYMFKDCTALIEAPSLPATTLANYCYAEMFSNCTSLTQAPNLPATTLANYCYIGMFRSCTSLTQAPNLPATRLADNCYTSMFYNCTSLTQAPNLPATTLANYCYADMFYNCTSLTQVPSLPATTLADSCYLRMFRRCSSLKLSSTKTDEYTQEYRIPSSGSGITASKALTDMFGSTGGTFKGIPSINTTYYLSSDNMIVRGNDIATLNGYVGSMINNAIPKSGALIVTITDNNGTLSADMTFSEILNAINAGISVLVYYNRNYFPFMGILADDLYFGSCWCTDADDLDGAAVVTPMIEITENDKVIDLSAQIFIPKELPNPNALTFTGAVTGSYDGSNPVSVEIPSAVTDDHINELINTALSKIGVAEGVSY